MGIPCNVRPIDVQEVVPELSGFDAPFLQDIREIPQLARISFRNGQWLQVRSFLCSAHRTRF